MAKKKDKEIKKNQEQVKKAVLNSLKEQKKLAIKTIEAFEDMNEKLGFELLPFVEIAQKNLLHVINQQIKMLQKTM